MKSRRTQIISLIATILIVGGFVAMMPHIVSAQDSSKTGGVTSTGGAIAQQLPGVNYNTGTDSCISLSGVNVASCITSVLTFFINNILLSVANWFLVITGVILNAVMILTI